MPRRPASGFADDAGYPVAGGSTADDPRSGGGNHDESTRYGRPASYDTPAGYGARPGYPTPAGYPGRGAYGAPAAPAPVDREEDTLHIQRPASLLGSAGRSAYPEPAGAGRSPYPGPAQAGSAYAGPAEAGSAYPEPARDESGPGAPRYGSTHFGRPALPGLGQRDPAHGGPDQGIRDQGIPEQDSRGQDGDGHRAWGRRDEGLGGPTHGHRHEAGPVRGHSVTSGLTGGGVEALDDDGPAEPLVTGAHRRSREGLKGGRDTLRGLVARTGGEPSRRTGRRLSTPSRRTMTIAAVTTGTIAVSTAAFAGVNPGGAVNGGSEASLVGNGGSTSTGPQLLNIAQSVADTEAVATAVSITPDHTSVSPNAPVMLTVRAVQSGGVPLANQPVRVVVAIGTTWRTTAVLRTDADGRASIPAHLLTTTKVSVIFDGTGALRPALASATTVNVVVPQPVTTSGGGGVNPADVGLTNAPGSTVGSKAVYLASLQRGKPYVWGATGPYSFDCSGLVQYVYRQLGRYVPRTAEAQFESTTRIAQSAKQPGDLIFFGSPGDIYHVAIYAGNGYIWQAPQTGETVQLVPIWSSSYYVGRVL